MRRESFDSTISTEEANASKMKHSFHCLQETPAECAPASGDAVVATLCEEAARVALLSLVLQSHLERACGYLDDLPPLCCETHLFLWCATGGLLERRQDSGAAQLPGFRCPNWKEPGVELESNARDLAAADSTTSAPAVSAAGGSQTTCAFADVPDACPDGEPTEAAEATESLFLPISSPREPFANQRSAKTHKSKSKPGEWRERFFAATNGALIQAHFRDVDSVHEIKSGALPP